MYVDASEFNPFKELAFFTRKILNISHSNAEAERVFSKINIPKCKQRNKTGYKLLNATLNFRTELNTVGKNCHVYEVCSKSIRLFCIKHTTQRILQVLFNLLQSISLGCTHTFPSASATS